MRDIHIAGPWMTDLEKSYVEDAMDNWYGKEAYAYVERFESEFAKYIGRKYCLMTPNATSALHLALLALDVKGWNDVIVPDLTWIATASRVHYQRAGVVFCDVERDNWCSSSDTVAKVRNIETRAVIAVDLHGNMPDMDSLEAYCYDNGLYLVECFAPGTIVSNLPQYSYGKVGREGQRLPLLAQ